MTDPAAEGDRRAAAKLLWTGGWDSTYRLLDLLLVRGQTVQPYHFRTDRASAPLEIRTMATIRERLLESRPQARTLLLETLVKDLAGIPADEELYRHFLHLRELSRPHPFGGQIYWLAAAARHFGLRDVELGIHAEPGAPWYDLLLGSIEADTDTCRTDTYRLAARLEEPALELFRGFSLPLLLLSKADMAERAQAAGFADILEMTWFCYTPDRRGRPCGLCAPCRLTIEQGLARRIPAGNRLRHRLLWPAITVLRKHRVRARARHVLRTLLPPQQQRRTPRE